MRPMKVVVKTEHSARMAECSVSRMYMPMYASNSLTYLADQLLGRVLGVDGSGVAVRRTVGDRDRVAEV